MTGTKKYKMETAGKPVYSLLIAFRRIDLGEI
jgi:hypothetical protein